MLNGTQQNDHLTAESESTESTFITQLNEFVSDNRKTAASTAWSTWLRSYATRIDKEDSDAWEGDGDWLERREEYMKASNPRFVLRQWVLEEVIAKCEGDVPRSRAILSKMLEV